jgi:hypothetical protein
MRLALVDRPPAGPDWHHEIKRADTESLQSSDVMAE